MICFSFALFGFVSLYFAQKNNKHQRNTISIITVPCVFDNVLSMLFNLVNKPILPAGGVLTLLDFVLAVETCRR